jgi:hypothetical protein
MREFGFYSLEIPILSEVINIGNNPSAKLEKRLGLKYKTRMERQIIQFVEYSLIMSDW